MSLFVKPLDKYRRHVGLVEQAIIDNARFLSIMTGFDTNYCRDWVRDNFKKTGGFPLKNPTVCHTQRTENYDRIEVRTPFLRYIDDIYKNNKLVSGALTVYHNPTEVPSPFTPWIKTKKKNRSKVKKIEQEHDMRQETHLANLARSEQISLKTLINSLSGGETVESCPIYLSTAHPTLTITCRITANNGGAILERFIGGNRHYYSPDATMNSIVNTITMANLDAIDAVMKKYNFHYPTEEETIETVFYSTALYWKDLSYGKPKEKTIKEFISKCSPLERAAIVYVGDFYHLFKYNPEFCTALIVDTMNPTIMQLDDPLKIINDADDDVRSFATIRYKNDLEGIAIPKDIGKHPELANSIANVIISMQKRFTMMQDIIFSLWATDVGPHSIAAFPDSLRRVVPAGDTDSTFFTLMHYVNKVHNKFTFSNEEWGTAAIVGFMATSLVTHQLYQMTTNFGTISEDIKVVDMKNEFGYSVFMPTQASKHYIAAREIKEGNILPKYYLEAKGVSLISQDAPDEIVQGAEDLERYIIEKIRKGEKISIVEICESVANVERRIIASINRGEGTFLRSTRTNEAQVYKEKENNSTFRLHLLWNNTFGAVTDTEMIPPYTHKVVPVDLDSKAKLKDWIADINDNLLDKLLLDFLTANDMLGGLATIRVPEAYLAKNPIPPHIAKKAKIRSVVQKLMTRFYLLLEGLGYYAFEKSESMLVSDIY